jgi:hypothetical protein
MAVLVSSLLRMQTTQRSLLTMLFGLTGATALLIEQAFEKLLSTLLGSSTPAAAMVLAMYFGGLALGAWLYGRVRRVSPSRMFAALEVWVGVWALALAAGFDRLTPACTPPLAHRAGSLESDGGIFNLEVREFLQHGNCGWVLLRHAQWWSTLVKRRSWIG